MKKKYWISLITLALFALPSILLAQEAPKELSMEQTAFMTANNVWMLVATAMVFIMHLGFATLEAGLTQSKNTVNILCKNMVIVAIGILTYALIGFNLMYPGDSWLANGWLGNFVFGIGAGNAQETLASAWDYAGKENLGAYPYWTDFIFQGMFAATAATIVSGAVAERVKLSSFLIFSTIYVALIYPIAGSWYWGGGWLSAANFKDFAGSTLVHSVGGWGALVGVLMLGPRIGKYVKGRVHPILGHNLPLATIGVFLLWFGWYGFNGGSVLNGDPLGVSYVFVTTTLAAAAGVIGALITAWALLKKPDLSMVLNGALAGLVGITAGADVVGLTSSVIIGISSGVLVVVAVTALDKAKIDDPVGAISVHLICGIWGTLCAGIFMLTSKLPEGMTRIDQIIVQLKGVGAYAVICIVGSAVIFGVIKAIMGLRVDPEEEQKGLDVSEHGNTAYPDFVGSTHHN